jgi:hypothetical protein
MNLDDGLGVGSSYSEASEVFFLLENKWKRSVVY